MLLKLFSQIDPDHIAVAFDRPKPTFRQELYPAYQAQRPATDSDLSPQFEGVLEVLSKASVPVYAVDGFEADDVIGTIVEKLKKQDVMTYIVTGDRDLLQLINNNAKVLFPVKGISEVMLFDKRRVNEKYEVDPIQIIELKALTGDPSDNYPGVSGIGPKTATKLLKKYKDVDTVYKNIEEIESENPKLAEKLINGKKMAKLSHQLATIITQVPFDFKFEDCNLKTLSLERFRDALEDYEFNSLVKRFDETFYPLAPFDSAQGKAKKKKNGKSQMKLL